MSRHNPMAARFGQQLTAPPRKSRRWPNGLPAWAYGSWWAGVDPRKLRRLRRRSARRSRAIAVRIIANVRAFSDATTKALAATAIIAREAAEKVQQFGAAIRVAEQLYGVGAARLDSFAEPDTSTPLVDTGNEQG